MEIAVDLSLKRLPRFYKNKYRDSFKLIGELDIDLIDPITGELVSTEHIINTVTTTGKAGVMDQILASPTLAKAAWMAIGTGAPAANALGTEVSRVALTSKTRSTNVVTFVGDFPAGTPAGTNVITEYGVFDAASVGNMWQSGTSGGQSKDPSLAMTVNWTLTGA